MQSLFQQHATLRHVAPCIHDSMRQFENSGVDLLSKFQDIIVGEYLPVDTENDTDCVRFLFEGGNDATDMQLPLTKHVVESIVRCTSAKRRGKCTRFLLAGGHQAPLVGRCSVMIAGTTLRGSFGGSNSFSFTEGSSDFKVCNAVQAVELKPVEALHYGTIAHLYAWEYR